MKSSVPAATPAQIRAALIASAIDIEAVGTDVDTGAGIVMAHAAIQAVGGVPQAFLAAGTAVPTEAVGDADASAGGSERARAVSDYRRRRCRCNQARR